MSDAALEAVEDLPVSANQILTADSNHHNGVQVPKSSSATPTPTLFHSVRHEKSILAVAVSDEHIFAGSQDGEILVWDLATYSLEATIQAHSGSVLCLFLYQEEPLLFSSAGDAIINVWSIPSLNRLYSIYSTYDVGDVFCVAYSPLLHTVYLGAQNTSIQWYDLRAKDTRPLPNPTSHPTYRNHRFFDSKGPGGVCTPRPVSPRDVPSRPLEGQVLEIDRKHIVQYAHFGYVYCMLLAREFGRDGHTEESLISGGGDGTVKLWKLDLDESGTLIENGTLENGDNSVLSIAKDGSFLYAGLSEGEINVWDLETRQLVRSVKAHPADILTLAVGGDCIFSGASNGMVKKLNRRYECISQWEGHRGLVLASALVTHRGRRLYVTGGNDARVAVWDLSDMAPNPIGGSKSGDERMLGSLSRFISFRSVSSDFRCAEECRRCATWLKNVFRHMGAQTSMLATMQPFNPIVFAKFSGKSSSQSERKRILFYGHYDVVAAEDIKARWRTDPFTMTGEGGFLYGRGASDNKGPVLAALYAAAALVERQALDSDILFLIEGEEESGSRGLEAAVRQNRHLIGDVDYVLCANSYWLTDHMPCMTYGLRGVIHATVTIESDRPDLHSGVDGSSLLDEALKDLIQILAQLTTSGGRINIPGFYDPIPPVTKAEEERYAAITRTLIDHNPKLGSADELNASLKKRWSEPSITIHQIKSSGPPNSTTIPRLAKATLSLRLVPNQEVAMIRSALTNFLTDRFQELGSQNHLAVSIDHEAEPWLGDPDSTIFKVLEQAIVKVWSSDQDRDKGKASDFGHDVTTTLGAKAGKGQFGKSTARSWVPLAIREGGTIPAIPFMERELQAETANFPVGQSTDAAHLNDERIRLLNLYRGRQVFERVFKGLTTLI
ncbi:MAG: hypothetical protein M1817_003118 [Caeruleum heppii]|nr:MAG: hypothetical protein M1817_003118 [Caeruleum heppii]